MKQILARFESSPLRECSNCIILMKGGQAAVLRALEFQGHLRILTECLRHIVFII